MLLILKEKGNMDMLIFEIHSINEKSRNAINIEYWIKTNHRCKNENYRPPSKKKSQYINKLKIEISISKFVTKYLIKVILKLARNLVKLTVSRNFLMRILKEFSRKNLISCWFSTFSTRFHTNKDNINLNSLRGFGVILDMWTLKYSTVVGRLGLMY